MDMKSILHRYSLHITKHHWDAEDVTQEAWLKLNEAKRKNPEREITKAYLYRIVKHAWIDMGRKNRLQAVPLHPLYEEVGADASLSSRELLELLAERLPPKMAVILLLMDVFDFTAKETAAYVGMKEAAVQVSLGRARRRMQELAPYAVRDQAVPAAQPIPVHFEALVEAFRRQDPALIHRAFMGLTREGIQLAGLQALGGRLHFTFRDPDGNLFQAVSN
ncbi:RNA polymerase sigma factor [Paenibacillus sp. R14(2021)]|uniref:RNA polymerase sigma factor n=1 Tax=Paenibacillus sp. R14(2021) TaxID=2859228 RepID=UPI002157D580|nr:RNA polymerase sigma factor [Paenibacillus sp. R14(2021)]